MYSVVEQAISAGMLRSNYLILKIDDLSTTNLDGFGGAEVIDFDQFVTKIDQNRRPHNRQNHQILFDFVI